MDTSKIVNQFTYSKCDIFDPIFIYCENKKNVVDYYYNIKIIEI